MAVVVGRAQAAVDLRRREDEAAPLAQRRRSRPCVTPVEPGLVQPSSAEASWRRAPLRYSPPPCRSTSTAARTATSSRPSSRCRRTRSRVRGMRRRRRARLPPGRRPLQGLRLLHHRLRPEGIEGIGPRSASNSASEARRRRTRPKSESDPRSRVSKSDSSSSKSDSSNELARRAAPTELGRRAADRVVLGLVAGELLDRPDCTPRAGRSGSGCRVDARRLRAPSVRAAADRRREDELRHRQRAHVGDERLRRVPADERALDEVVGERAAGR